MNILVAGVEMVEIEKERQSQKLNQYCIMMNKQITDYVNCVLGKKLQMPVYAWTSANSTE